MQLRKKHPEFERAGVHLVAVAVDTPERVGALAKELGLPFPVYADPQHRLADVLGVYNLLRDGVAAPSVFLADSTGRIVWRYVGRDIADRADEVLRQAERVAAARRGHRGIASPETIY